MPLKKGTVLEDRLVIGDILGSGAYGCVYEATHSEMGKEVVVKYCHHADLNDQFKQEEKIYNRLREDHEKKFTELYESFLYKGRMVLVLERVGEGVGTQLRNGYCHSLSSVLDISKGVFRRIFDLHNIGYLHRDIRDGNILYGLELRHRHVYLIDFSISQKFIHADGEHIEKGDDPYPAGNNFFSTGSYHSRQLHSRRDDLESFLYVFAYLLNGVLPWSHLKNEEAVWKEKKQYQKSDMFKEMPAPYRKMWTNIKELPFKAEPDYHWLSKQLFCMD